MAFSHATFLAGDRRPGRLSTGISASRPGADRAFTPIIRGRG
jgi:hypothetical protein